MENLEQSEFDHNSEWHDTQRQEQHIQELELRLLELSEKVVGNNLRIARLNLAATIIFGVIVVMLSLMQLRLTVISQPHQQPSSPVEFEINGTTPR